MKRFLNILFQRDQEGNTQERLSVVNIENIDDIIVILVPLLFNWLYKIMKKCCIILYKFIILSRSNYYSLEIKTSEVFKISEVI